MPHRTLIVGSILSLVSLAACSGTPADPDDALVGQTVPVDPLSFQPSHQGCPSGLAHPKVCCTGSEDVASHCVKRVDDPFAACAAGWETYEDGDRCCDKDDADQCVSCADGHCGHTEQPMNWACLDVCPPGWFGDKFDGEEGCCHSTSDGDGDIGVACLKAPKPKAGAPKKMFCAGACPAPFNHFPNGSCCGVASAPSSDASGMTIKVTCSDGG